MLPCGKIRVSLCCEECREMGRSKMAIRNRTKGDRGEEKGNGRKRGSM